MLGHPKACPILSTVAAQAPGKKCRLSLLLGAWMWLFLKPSLLEPVASQGRQQTFIALFCAGESVPLGNLEAVALYFSILTILPTSYPESLFLNLLVQAQHHCQHLIG